MLGVVYAQTARQHGPGSSAAERAQESMGHNKRIRGMLTTEDKATDIRGGSRPTRQAKTTAA